MRKKNQLAGNLFAFGCVFAPVFLCASFAYFILAPASGPERVVVEIRAGERLSHAADSLKSAGAIASRPMFKLWMYAMWKHNAIKAGEYEIPPRSSINDIKNIITSGRMMSRFVTVPEGLTLLQIHEVLNSVDDLPGKITITAAEGELMPQTYAYSRGMTKDDVIAKMKAAMKETVAAEWAARAEGLPFATPEEAVILASIIEKETSVEVERGLVASVFVNRLARGMRLQSDPTVVYTLTKKYGSMGGRKLYKKDLQVDTPYNTYTRKGLPAGAICNPGIASILAAMNPPDTDYLYFVADGSGGHRFAKTLKEHEKNRAEWKKARAE
ncbi:MAG: endolytic transglycosylase MltG [Rickettsiales bacterium]|jgi:UPF0755 protein|nr:endolytic transglycosylase MltG [Rickettsiales bacterium]